jgi:hypothetical protein
MGFLDSSSVTVDAILTKRGRQILSQGGNFSITKFALSDEEVDYTLYDVTHPSGTDSYGVAIENISLLEAAPNRTAFRSYLTNMTLSGNKLTISPTSYSDQESTGVISLNPQSDLDSKFQFTIENTNVVRFVNQGSSKTLFNVEDVKLKPQSISTAASTIVTVTGLTSGMSAVISIHVKADPLSDNDPNKGSEQ